MLTNEKKPSTLRKPKTFQIKTVDSRSHAFNVGIAMDYSPNIALFIAHLGFWSEKNLANNKNIHDGLVWCYDTLDAMCEYFPYFTRRQIETIINNSVKQGLVQCGNYNKTGYDRTTWYALTPKAYFYFQHLLTEKYLNRLFVSISQICEIDFTEFVNRFPITVTTIPNTSPDTDPNKKSEGGKPSTHSINPISSKKEIQSKASFEDAKAKKFFNTKFAGINASYEQLFQECTEHYESKSQWVTVKKWKAWIEREKLDNYGKEGTAQSKAPENETEIERQNRQFITYEIIKERTNNGYISEILQKKPELREKYAEYVKQEQKNG